MTNNQSKQRWSIGTIGALSLTTTIIIVISFLKLYKPIINAISGNGAEDNTHKNA